MKPARGQKWSLLVEQRGWQKGRVRLTFLIRSIKDGFASGVLLETGELHSIAARVLAKGMRGARPADEKPRTPKLAMLDAPIERRPPREVKPRGIQSPNEKYAEALKMKRAGASLREIAEAFDTKPANVSNWLVRARDRERDEKQARAMGDD